MGREDEEVNWSAVIARCLAFLCLKNSDSARSPILEQADFLEKLGLPFEDRAGVIGTTVASLRELSRQARKKKGARRNGKANRRR
jgi:hypothetical protein